MRFSYFFIILSVFLLVCCGKKLDPSLEDYKPPEAVQKLSLTQQEEKIVISWSYPEKQKARVASFLIEKTNNNKTEVIGYFDPLINTYEDSNFTYGENYLYRIYAISKKGIYSAAKEASIQPQRLSAVENISYEITVDGVRLSWSGEKYSGYNIYKLDSKGQRIKVSTVNEPEVFIKLSKYDFENGDNLIFAITNFLEKNSFYIETKATFIKIPYDAFVPSTPKEVHYGINEEGVFLSWQEVPERWIKGYKVYRKISENYEFIGETMIPLFSDSEYTVNNIKLPLYYKILSVGPAVESNPVEIKVEVPGG